MSFRLHVCGNAEGSALNSCVDSCDDQRHVTLLGSRDNVLPLQHKAVTDNVHEMLNRNSFY